MPGMPGQRAARSMLRQRYCRWQRRAPRPGRAERCPASRPSSADAARITSPFRPSSCCPVKRAARSSNCWRERQGALARSYPRALPRRAAGEFPARGAHHFFSFCDAGACAGQHAPAERRLLITAPCWDPPARRLLLGATFLGRGQLVRRSTFSASASSGMNERGASVGSRLAGLRRGTRRPSLLTSGRSLEDALYVQQQPEQAAVPQQPGRRLLSPALAGRLRRASLPRRADRAAYAAGQCAKGRLSRHALHSELACGSASYCSRSCSSGTSTAPIGPL